MILGLEFPLMPKEIHAMAAAGWAAARDRLLAGIPEPFSDWLAARADQLLRLPLSYRIPSAARPGSAWPFLSISASLPSPASGSR